MGAYLVSAGVQKITGGIILAGKLAQKSIVITVGDETNVLGIPFLSVNKALLQGDGSNLILGQFTQREADMR